MNKQLNTILKNARIDANLSQSEVASHLGFTSPQFVSNWERHLCSPPLEKLKPIMKLLKVPKQKVLVALLNDYSNEIQRALR